ncbi:ribonuclease 1 isoform X2 [Spinacia oleracea]|uniref:Ribonuclease 1 isoform X2 n=1 Tax=Spinacia oleracea TaxID=3562 RepID=A0ABM3R5J9_SPIOL|nr:ribonuclease 1-like isoform X2 [Spinacia oleracea]
MLVLRESKTERMAKRESLIFMNKLVLLLNIAAVVLGNDSSSSSSSSTPGFHAFYFIQQWLPSYCNQQGTTCCDPPAGKLATNFTIYGLWPYSDDGSALQNCPGETFDVSPLKAIESMLEKEWPSYTCPQIGRKFWVHEYNKHGTCSKSFLDEMSYFQAALNLKDKINVLQALVDAGIQPNDQFYPLEIINTAITTATGFRPFIFCNYDAQGNSQIWQVLHCVDKTGMEFITCPSSEGQKDCASTIKFPF